MRWLWVHFGFQLVCSRRVKACVCVRWSHFTVSQFPRDETANTWKQTRTSIAPPKTFTFQWIKRQTCWFRRMKKKIMEIYSEAMMSTMTTATKKVDENLLSQYAQPTVVMANFSKWNDLRIWFGYDLRRFRVAVSCSLRKLLCSSWMWQRERETNALFHTRTGRRKANRANENNTKCAN